MAKVKAVKAVFNHRGRTCVVIELGFELPPGMNKMVSLPESFHNGYVSVDPSHEGKSYNDFCDRIDTEELTFGGKFEGRMQDEKIPSDVTFFGFDTTHCHNTPATQSFEYARKQTIKLADEMIKEGI